MPPDYTLVVRLSRRTGDPEEYLGQGDAMRASLEPWWQQAYHRVGRDDDGRSPPRAPSRDDDDNDDDDDDGGDDGYEAEYYRPKQEYD